jgi:hypothetical protein
MARHEKEVPQEAAREAARPAGKHPDKATVVATDTLTMPDGARYTILETDQTDPYDPPPKRPSRRGR